MPTIESFYPNNESTGIPIGASIVIIFDVPIDSAITSFCSGQTLIL
jgi:hypothetical protein